MLDPRLEAMFRIWLEHGGKLRLEPTQRRVRTVLDGVTVADSRRVQLLFFPPPLNAYVFPMEDVRKDVLTSSDENGSALLPGVGPIRQWTVQVGRRVAQNAAWTATQPPAGLEALAGMVAFRWALMDSWYEEDDEVFVHPRDPYHRVDVLASSRHVKVTIDSEIVAETRKPHLLFETGLPVRYYIPRLDIRMDLLEPTATTSRCPYKGVASYWSAQVAGNAHTDIAWSYRLPIPECPKIENLISFFNEKVDIDVDGVRQDRPKTPWS